MSSVALIGSDAEYRAGLVRILTGSERYVVAASVRTVAEALTTLAQREADMVIMDVSPPHGLEPDSVRRLRAAHPASRVVLLTMFDDREELFEALREGGAGYVLKSFAPAEMLARLDEIDAGGAWMSRAVARRVLNHFGGSAAPWGGKGQLTEDERKLVDALLRGEERAADATPGDAQRRVFGIFAKLAGARPHSDS